LLTPRRPKQDPPGRLTRDFTVHKLEKTADDGEGKKKTLYPVRWMQHVPPTYR